MHARILSLPLLCLAAVGAAHGQNPLWEVHGTNSGDTVGHAVAGGADFNLDGYDDVIVGAPGMDTGGFSGNGAVRVLSGFDGSVLQTKVGEFDGSAFGSSVAVADDIDGDGHPDYVVGAPWGISFTLGLFTGMARVISGKTSATIHTVYGTESSGQFGYAVTGRFDWDGDGVGDFAVGAPLEDVSFSLDSGRVHVFSGATGTSLAILDGQGALGTALGTGNLNGDSRRDLVIGASEAGGLGRVVAFDGASHLELWTFIGGFDVGTSLEIGDVDADAYDEVFTGAPPSAPFSQVHAGSVTWLSGQYGLPVHTLYGSYALDSNRFGASVSLIEDLDGDGLLDLLVGAPARNLSVDPGAVHVLSTGSLNELFRIEGQPDYGSSVAWAGDCNGDGTVDFVVGDPTADDLNDPTKPPSVGGAFVYSSEFPDFVTYCTAGTSASGCQALIAASGVPSATAASGFLLSAAGVQGNKTGMFFYGANGRQANPWGNGTSFNCVTPPVKRGGLLFGAGTTGACDGSLLQDLNAHWCPSCPNPDHNFGAGATVQAQLWYRDPLNTSNQSTSLSDAVEFVMQP